MAVSPLLGIFQFIGFLFAMFSNCLLLYAIKMRADAKFGRYRLMMIAFSIYAIVYATVEILTLPVLHTHEASVLFYVDGYLKEHYSAGVITATVYCGSFALCIALLATHFVYRYIAVCKDHKIYLFEGKYIYFWVLPPLSLFSIWVTSTYLNYRPTDLKRDLFRNITMELYDENIDEIPFLALVYYTRLSDGTKVFRASDIIGSFLACIIIGLCFGTCLICALKTYRKLNDISIRMSSRTRALNKQLFWTLGLQTLLPCLTQYMPVALLFIVPIFEIDVGRMGNLVGVACSLYPAMDPLIAIFIIDRFRNFIFGKEIRRAKVSSLNSDGTSALNDGIPKRLENGGETPKVVN